MSRTFVCFAAPAAVILVAAAAQAGTYSNDFENPVGAEWSNTSTDTTPVGNRHFLGQFSNDSVILSLANLPTHDSVTITFDLYIMRTWDGNAGAGGEPGGIGPDRWTLRYDSGEPTRGSGTLLDTTFANADFFSQSYPDPYLTAENPALTGAAETDTLGFSPDDFGDSVYKLSFTFPHAGDSLFFTFSGSNLEGIDNETWGLDDLTVSTTPSPSAAALAGLGLLSGLRRRRR